MSRFFRAGLPAALVAFVVAFAPSPVLADANPNNHGHHYGQLKHRQPLPVPNPPPSSPPVSSTTTAAAPAASPRGGVPSAVQQGTSALPQLTIDVPLPVLRLETVKTVPPTASGDESWLLLLILPALLAVWALVFTRAALALARLRRARPGQPGSV